MTIVALIRKEGSKVGRRGIGWEEGAADVAEKLRQVRQNHLNHTGSMATNLQNKNRPYKYEFSLNIFYGIITYYYITHYYIIMYIMHILYYITALAI